MVQASQKRLQEAELKLAEARRMAEAADAASREALAGERRVLAAAREDAQRHRERADNAEGHLRTAASNLGALHYGVARSRAVRMSQAIGVCASCSHATQSHHQ